MMPVTKRTLALFGAGVFVTLAWPGPAGARTDLGGYSGLAQAAPIRIQIYEPTIPIPTTPQIDGSIGYTKSTTETGPLSRATASYLWPGDTLGDGFGALAGNDKAQYPVQVNSRYPATSGAPAKNAGQLTDGNGMVTSSNEHATTATVTGAGIAGPGTNILGGIGKGLKNLPGLGSPQPSASSSAPAPKTPALPIPVSKSLAAVVTANGVRSESDVVVGKNRVTSFAHTHVAEVKLLGGLLTIGSLDVTSKTVSNGAKATTTGHATVGALAIGGQNLGLDEKGLNLAGTKVKLPKLPVDITQALKKLGIEVNYLQTQKSTDAATGSLASQALTVSIDTAPLKKMLGLDPVLAQLGDALGKIPNLGSQLAPLAGLGPKIVVILGDVQSSATAAPAFTGGTTPPPPPPHTGGNGHHGGGTTTGGNTGGTTTGGAATGGIDTGNTPPVDTGGNNPPAGTGGSGPVDTTPAAVQQTALDLPALRSVPRALILGGLLFALAAGWALRAAGSFLLGAGANCAQGLPSGVPDLRQR